MNTHYTSQSLSIVIPIYNEEEILADSAKQILTICEKTKINYEIILVENGSTDETINIAYNFSKKHTNVKIINLKDPNYGNALKKGFLEAQNDLVVSFDIDYFSEFFLNEALCLDNSFAAVTASKRMQNSRDDRNVIRKVATKIFVLILKTLFNTDLSDTHGMKAIRKKYINEHIEKVVSTQDLFDTELLLRIEKSNQKIKEVPAKVNEIRPSVSVIYKRIPRTVIALVKLKFYFSREDLNTKSL